MSHPLLQNRDYTIILARNAKKSLHSPPGLQKQWEIAEKSLLKLVQKCEELDTDGISIYIAENPVRKYEQETSQGLIELIESGYGVETVELFPALEVAIHNYFERKAEQQTKVNGEIIVVVLDSEPRDRRKIVKLLVKATEQMENQEELGIMFAQVGEDSLATGFLTALDDDLHSFGAKFDLADTMILAEIEDEEIPQVFLNALYG